VVLAYVLPVPSTLIYAAAGWTGMSLRRFLVLDLAGTCLWVALIVGLGYGIGHPAVNVAHAISKYGLLLTLALIPAAFVIAAVRAGARRRVPDPADP
jgi:membrane protein DedA with SNARE-associated domain